MKFCDQLVSARCERTDYVIANRQNKKSKKTETKSGEQKKKKKSKQRKQESKQVSVANKNSTRKANP